ncbi:hypothetical protein AB0E44_13520 [Micrococcus terreus]|uniref:hypothetical protein n=1 Tax=Micrococcus terreus TaxID=574650 RepID=UPI0033E88722
MNELHADVGTVTVPSWGLNFSVPAGWNVDDSGIDAGVLIVSTPEPWTAGFQPNLVLTMAAITADQDAADTVLREQQSLDAVLDESLADYRLVHLGPEPWGTPERDGVHRMAVYTGENGLPVMMSQWVARSDNREISMTFTYPVADFSWGIDGGRAMAESFVWSEAE